MQLRIKKIVLTLLSIIIVIVLVRKVYVLFFKIKPPLAPTVQLVGTIDAHEDGACQIRNGYDFSRMIKLIDQTIELKRAFYEQFVEERPPAKTIDVKKSKELLADLYREKVRLGKYAWRVRVRYKGDVPPKKRRTIIYYQRVVEKCIRDVEMIVRQL